MIRTSLPELEVSSEKIFDFSNEEIKEIIEDLGNKFDESARINRKKEIESIQEVKKIGKFSSLGFQSQKKKILTM